MSGAQQLEVTVSGARSNVEQMKEIPGVKSFEITREISEEMTESDKDETPGTDASEETSEQPVETQNGEYHLSIMAKENQDKLILLGDLYYHGPRNPLTNEYSPMEVAQILNKYKDIIYCTRGNCDAEVDEMISDFKFEEYIVLNINDRVIAYTDILKTAL